MDRIQFLYKNKVVGETDLPDFSTDEDRYLLALSLDVKQYDNIKFLKQDGTLRIDYNMVIWYGVPYGYFSGNEYSKRIKEGFIND